MGCGMPQSRTMFFTIPTLMTWTRIVAIPLIGWIASSLR